MFTLFQNSTLIATGTLAEIALQANIPHALVFEDATGKVVDLDLRGTNEEITARYSEKPVVGRPKLGVVAREITLLPRHWEWLNAQQGGASVTLRKLIDEARKTSLEKDMQRLKLERTHKFMTAMAGDLPHYEDALRLLYAHNFEAFYDIITDWPKDIKNYIQKLLNP